MILQNRTTWNIQRALLVPVARSGTGVRLRELLQHLRHRGAAALRPHPEARLQRLQGLHGRDHPAGGEHHRGAGPGKLHQGLDPDLLLCLKRGRLDLRLPLRREPRSRPAPRRYTRATPLPNGAHTFSVKAIDAPGNESAVVSRSFTVDTVAPPDHDHLRALGRRPPTRPPPSRFSLQRVGLDLRLSLRLPGVRPLLGAGRQPHPLHPALPRRPQLRRPGHRQGQEHRPDPRQRARSRSLLASTAQKRPLRLGTVREGAAHGDSRRGQPF